MIRFQCPTCNKRLKCPGEGAGRKIECPRCGQRLLIPNPVKPAARNKTVLGSLLPESQNPGPNSSPSGWLDDVRKAQDKDNNQTERNPTALSHAGSPPSPLDRLEEVTDAPDSARPLSGSANALRLRKEDGSILLGVLLTIGGFLLAIIGFLTLGYWLDYDTSVSTYFGDRVHNVGLMQNRLIGVLVGGGILVVGLALYIVGLFVSPSKARKWLLLGTVLPPFLFMLVLFFLGLLVTFLLVR